VSKEEDQKFFDLFTLIIGLLIGVTFGIFLLAQYVGGQTQQVWSMADPVAQAEVMARIAPAGRVTLPGDEQVAPAAEQVAAAKPVAAPMSGPQVYNAACVACHGAGIGGAPKLGDTAAWTGRLAQGTDVLTDHVINGYTGDAGYMPPKGGRVDLSDEEIIAAMNYLLDESR
jgi:cytochrome c5